MSAFVESNEIEANQPQVDADPTTIDESPSNLETEIAVTNNVEDNQPTEELEQPACDVAESVVDDTNISSNIESSLEVGDETQGTEDIDNQQTVEVSSNDVPVVETSLPQDEPQDLDRAIEAIQVDYTDDCVVSKETDAANHILSTASDGKDSDSDAGQPTVDDKGMKRESVDDLKQWIRQTSSKLKSFRRDSFKKADSGTDLSPTKASSDVTADVSKYAYLQKPIPSQSTAQVKRRQPNTIPYEELVRRNVEKDYEGLIQTSLEKYLDADEFFEVFGKTKVCLIELVCLRLFNWLSCICI